MRRTLMMLLFMLSLALPLGAMGCYWDYPEEGNTADDDVADDDSATGDDDASDDDETDDDETDDDETEDDD